MERLERQHLILTIDMIHKYTNEGKREMAVWVTSMRAWAHLAEWGIFQ